MTSSAKNWSVSPFVLWRSPLTGQRVDSTFPGADKVAGATIHDKDKGVRYQAVVDPSGRVTHLSLSASEGAEVPDRLPLRRIAEQVRLHLAEESVAGMPVFTSREHRGVQDRPTPEVVARHWHEGKRRRELAALFQASVHTVDDWLRQARRLGLIPPAKTGRPKGQPQSIKPDETE